MRMREITNLTEKDVWHGTPHEFDKFSTDHLGTGEGFNSFGWGLYFTDKREIAEFYRNKLTRGTQTGGKLYRVSLPDEATRYLLWDESLGKQSKVIQTVAMSYLEINEEPLQTYKWGSAATFKTNMRLSHAVIEGRHGRFAVYADDGAWMLKRVFATFEDAASAARVKLKQQLLKQRGEGLYETLQWQLGTPKAASLSLLEKGVYGIKYLDGASRGDGVGSYNYVIFDPSHIRIAEVS